MSEALYRKYRPQIFEDVVGQEHIERTIKNAISQDKVSHAYLFTGPRGTGKTTTARLLAKALLCEKGPTAEPDGTCEDCVAIANGEHPDVYELDAASRTGVDNVREEIIGRVQFAPTRGRYKVYIIDEVHMLSTAAFNALLKTLEEPPSHVIFILCTTDPQKVPETIHSRCQRFDFRRISPEAMVARLGAVCVAEGVEFEGEALDLIAHRAEGGMRNALTSLEQLIAFGEGKVTLEVAERLLGSLDSSDLAEIVQAIGKRDVAHCFRWTAEYVETGADLAQFARDLAEHIRNMYIMTMAGEDVPLEVSETTRRELAEEMKLYGEDRLSRMLCVLGDLISELKTSSNPRLSFEIALTRMVRPDSDLTLEALAERVSALESGYSAVAHVISDGGTSSVRPSATSVNVNPAAPASQKPTPASSQELAVSAAASASVSAFQALQKHDEVATPASVNQATAPTGFANRQTAPTTAQQPIQQVSGQPKTQGAAISSAGAPASPGATVSAGAPALAGAGAKLSEQMLNSLQNPATLQRIWQAALTTLKKEKAAHGVLFLNTRAVLDRDNAVVRIEFPAENSFAYKTAQKAEIQDALAAALTQASGTPLPFVLAQAGPTVAAPVRAANVAAAPVVPTATPVQANSVQPAPAQMASAQPAPTYETPAPSAASAPTVAPVPTAAPAPAAAPAYEPTPVDAYDDMPPYDDEPYPEPQPDVFMPAVSPSTKKAPVEDETAWEALLTQNFGENIVFEELDD